MSRKTRTIPYLEGRILEILAKQQEFQTVNLRNIEEEHNFDIAVQLLISKKEIIRITDQQGMTIYKLVA